MLKNKHVIAALIITPILSVLAYFATDAYVSEKPHKAIEGEQYPLVAKSNCRYASGQCTLENGDVEIKLRTQSIANGLRTLDLESNIELSAAKVALSYDNEANEPTNMSNVDGQGQKWSAEFRDGNSETDQIQLVIVARNSIYYAQTGLIFETNESAEFTR